MTTFTDIYNRVYSKLDKTSYEIDYITSVIKLLEPVNGTKIGQIAVLNHELSLGNGSLSYVKLYYIDDTIVVHIEYIDTYLVFSPETVMTTFITPIFKIAYDAYENNKIEEFFNNYGIVYMSKTNKLPQLIDIEAYGNILSAIRLVAGKSNIKLFKDTARDML